MDYLAFDIFFTKINWLKGPTAHKQRPHNLLETIKFVKKTRFKIHTKRKPQSVVKFSADVAFSSHHDVTDCKKK